MRGAASRLEKVLIVVTRTSANILAVQNRDEDEDDDDDGICLVCAPNAVSFVHQLIESTAVKRASARCRFMCLLRDNSSLASKETYKKRKEEGRKGEPRRKKKLT